MSPARTAPQRDRLPSLTGLRFWAALLVVLYHLSREYRPLPWISPLAWYGRDGVTFFFVLSGFVLAWSYAGAAVPARVFYWRRAVRIMPLHLLATGLAVAVSLALGGVVPLRGVLLSLPLLQAWARSTATAGNSAAWSLSAEAWFYLLLPLLLPFLLRRRDRGLAVLGTVACGCGLLLWLAGWYGALAGSAGLRGWLLDYLPLSRTPQFVLGAVVGVAVKRGWRPPVPVGAAVAALLLWHLALVGWHDAVPDSRWYGPYSASQLLVAPLFAALIAAAAGRDADATAPTRPATTDATASRRPPGLLAGAWMRRLGHWSFAWYLVHQSCMHLVAATYGTPRSHTGVLLGWLLVLVLSLALAGTLYTWVERPIEARIRGRGPGAYTPHPGPSVPAARTPSSLAPTASPSSRRR
ncbi:acyltransferase family protein [Streptacidiphilus cavernicola]|uniref:Acyltransferase family protein n=1 Tax=Streptacidiphilus cavernicola TaxID=3342716 RepID=A0ABV6VSS9_9ACTN